MAGSSVLNPVGYFVKQHYNDRIHFGKQLIRERLNLANNLYSKNLLAHYGCVNAIEFSNKGELLASGGDDRRVLILNVERAIQGAGQPSAMRAHHISNIFCLGFDSTNSKIFSAGNDDQVIVHDVRTAEPVDYFLHEQPVYGLSIDPLNDNVFASACDDGRVLIYDIREPFSTEPFCLVSTSSAFHAVMFNPVEPRIVTTANSKEGVGLFDIRRPRLCVLRYGGNDASQSCMSVRFNQRGTQILALRRRLPPVLYSIHSPAHVCQFDHPGYYNSCTMKSCCFAGDRDQYVLSGSDDFNLYMWKIPHTEMKGQWVDSAHMILRGHRSIVNQVRFNPSNSIIASSGVEKLIKFWSPFRMPKSSGGLGSIAENSDDQRKVFSHEEYINLMLRSGQFMSHDYSHQSTKEDPRMMAFFDSLVQREIEGWSSDDTQASETDVPQQPQPSSDSDILTAEVQPLPVFYLEHVEDQSSVAPEMGSETPRPEGVRNRISQLIARKRAQLMRLARSRARSEVHSSSTGAWLLEVSSQHTSTTLEQTPHSHRRVRKAPKKLVKVVAETRSRRKRVTRATAPQQSDSSDEEDWRPTQKRKKLPPAPVSSSDSSNSDQGCSRLTGSDTEVPDCNPDEAIVTLNAGYYRLMSPVRETPEPTEQEAVTPDSGIVVGPCSSVESGVSLDHSQDDSCSALEDSDSTLDKSLVEKRNYDSDSETD